MTLKRVNCNGTETSIVDCDPNNWAWVAAGNQCRRSEMARVMCEEFDNSPPNRKSVPYSIKTQKLTMSLRNDIVSFWV